MKNAILPALVTGLILTVGCVKTPHSSMDENYNTSTDFAAAQAQNGALADGTLYPRHFSGEALNSLGQTKLAQIASASKSATNTVEIYFDMPVASLTDGRKDVVTQFLAERGVKAERIEMAHGENPHNKTLATLTSGVLYESKESGVGGQAAEFTQTEEGTGGAE